MKKIGVIIFIVAVALGILVSNIVSFGNFFSLKSPVSISFSSKTKGSGNVATEKREISDFTAVSIGGVFKVEIEAQREFGVEVEADDNLLPLIETEVVGDTLKLSTKRKLSTKNPIIVRVSAPNIEKLENSGVSRVTVSNLSNNSFKLDSSGASKMSVSGKTNFFEIDLSGMSRVEAASFQAEKVSVDASGASSAKVSVSRELSADLSGASRLRYKGTPDQIEKSISGASSLKQFETDR